MVMLITLKTNIFCKIIFIMGHNLMVHNYPSYCLHCLSWHLQDVSANIEIQEKMRGVVLEIRSWTKAEQKTEDPVLPPGHTRGRTSSL